MSAARDILHRLADLGATVERQGDKLMVRAGTAPVPKDILVTIREHKAEVMAALTTAPAEAAYASTATTTTEEQAHPWYSREAETAALAVDTGLDIAELDRDWPASAWRRLHHAKVKFWAAPRRDTFGNTMRYEGLTAEILAFSDLSGQWRRKHMASEPSGTVVRQAAARALVGFGITAPPGWEP